jgi:hypothetical protein
MTTFTFTYTLDELFEFCSEYTSKRIYNHKDPSENVMKDLVEHFSLRDDDKNMFKMLAKSGASEAFTAMKASAKELTDAFVFNTTLISNPTVTVGSVLFKGDFDDSVNSTQLDDALFKTICYYVLREWYILKGFEQESIVQDRNFQYNLSIIKNYGTGGGLGGGAVSQNDTGAKGSFAITPHITI